MANQEEAKVIRMDKFKAYHEGRGQKINLINLNVSKLLITLVFIFNNSLISLLLVIHFEYVLKW